jgi:hypothetical protein
MSFLDRTVGLEELLRALGGAPPADGGAGSGGEGGTASSERGARSSSSRTRTPAEAAPARAAATEPAVRPPEAGAPEAGPPGADPPGADPPEAGPAEAGPPPPAADALEAWTRWLEDGLGVPRGLGPFLRSAEVRLSQGGVLAVRPLPGPAIERLREPAVVAELRRGLGRYLSALPEVVVESPADGSEGPRRVTRSEVREDTLRALIRQEPRLERAVQELDLELME